MTLKLNESRPKNAEYIEYKVFNGTNSSDTMLDLISDGFLPMTFAQVMQCRLDVLNSKDKSLIWAWWNNGFDTADNIAYHPDGRIKIILDSQKAREIIIHGESQSPNFILPKGAYEKLEGEEFSKEDCSKYSRRYLTLEKALNNPFWRALARDPILHQEYVRAVFKCNNSEENRNENMGMHTLRSTEVLCMRILMIGNIEDGSYIDGQDNVISLYGNEICQLIGMAPGALNNRKIIRLACEQVMEVTLKYIAPINAEKLRKKLSPSLRFEEIMEKASEYVAPSNLDELRNELINTIYK